MAGSMRDHDDLTLALDAILGFDDACQTPLRLAQNLTTAAERCGWDGEEHAILWAARRVETYRRSITT